MRITKSILLSYVVALCMTPPASGDSSGEPQVPPPPPLPGWKKEAPPPPPRWISREIPAPLPPLNKDDPRYYSNKFADREFVWLATVCRRFEGNKPDPRLHLDGLSCSFFVNRLGEIVSSITTSKTLSSAAKSAFTNYILEQAPFPELPPKEPMKREVKVKLTASPVVEFKTALPK